MTVKTLLADGPINLRILLLKILRLFEFLLFRSRCSSLKSWRREKRNILHILHFVYPELLIGINWKRCSGNSFLWNLRKNRFSLTNNGSEGTPNLFLHKVSSPRCLLVYLLMQGKHYYCIFSNF